MPLTPEQISEINRKNASHSTGPKSQSGKSRSSVNACTHGLRAETLTLPNERGEWVRELTEEWLYYYQPRSPGRRALVERAVLATVHHKRSRRYLTGALDEQVRRATLDFNVQQEDVMRHSLDLLKTDPSAAVRGLSRTAAGCRQLISEFKGLQRDLSVDGHLVMAACDHLARLLGRRPEDPNDVTAFWLHYYNRAAREPRSEAMQAELTHPKSWPDTVCWKLGGNPPTPRQSQEWLRETVARELDELRALEERLRKEYEGPARATAVEKAMLLKPDDMALWLRYERMHDSMFHRAYSLLERPEAPRPDVEPIPDVEPRHEEKAVPSPTVESGSAEAAASSTATSPAGDGPVVTAEAVGERQSKRVATDMPVAQAVIAEPVAVTTPAVAPVQEPSAEKAPASEGRVGATEGDVERQSKRVATDAPVAQAVSPVAADSVGPRDPGEETAGAMADLVRDLIGEGGTWPSHTEDEDEDEDQDEDEEVTGRWVVDRLLL